jgi:hypothetical protein
MLLGLSVTGTDFKGLLLTKKGLISGVLGY